MLLNNLFVSLCCYLFLKDLDWLTWSLVHREAINL